METIEFLVIGKSGHGKSSFIMSFVNSIYADNISPSGEGQTTRYISEYNIFTDENIPYKVEVELLSKEEFCKRGIENCKIDGKKIETILKSIKSYVIKNNGFFNIDEFECKKELESIFDKHINENLINNYIINRINSNKNSDDELETIPNELEKAVNIALAEIYDHIYNELIEWLHKKNLQIDNNKIIINDKSINITKLIKKDENNKTFSSLVKFSKYDVLVSDVYVDMLHQLNIHNLRFVDTCGLDQIEKDNENTVKNIYTHILLSKYKNINNTLFIRKANKESPVDLSENIPLIFEVKSSAVCYVVFTHMDEEKAEKDKGLNDLKDTESDIYNKIRAKFENIDTSNEIINNRIRLLHENIIEYSSIKPSEYSISFKKLIKSIALGDKFIDSINEEYIQPDKWSEVFNDELFSVVVDKFYLLAPRYKQKLKENLKVGKLGYKSVTYTEEIGYFSHIPYKIIKERLKNYNDFKIIKYGRLNENEKTTLIEIFYEWINELLSICNSRFVSYPIDINSVECSTCSKKNDNCPLQKMYNGRKNVIDNDGFDRVYKWLNKVYDFKELQPEYKIWLKNYYMQKFVADFPNLCKKINEKYIKSNGGENEKAN